MHDYHDARNFINSNGAKLRKMFDFGTNCCRKIAAIKFLRNEMLGLSLLDAKNAIEDYFGMDGKMPAPSFESDKIRTEDRVLIENFLDRMRAHMTDRELAAFNRFISRT